MYQKFFRRIAGIAAAAGLSALVLSVPASASSVGFTEGLRDLVAGTVAIGDAGSRPSAAFDAGNVAPGHSINIFGHIDGDIDTYHFDADHAFTVSFIGNGLQSAGGSPTFVGFVLWKHMGSYSLAGGNVYATGTPAGREVLYGSFGPGSYLLKVYGNFGQQAPALYDVQVAAVPLPAAGLLLLGGLGALGFAARRRKGA
ncbi:VPLPA-CTERM sorting domain-containing protein [Roseicyclus sediminis]|uniref:VPLPA-CTERM sorting domain-containing protein n=1 Tax=Roseicyclus sediminis TaxID=2980997 RepID=UPI0021D301AE|nr:VPLPA-CTERM sorting domain-containing protein [Roseibacterium sp. SDUM158016]